jgi:hypothetical protein
VLLPARDVARDAGDDVAVAALGERLVDHADHIGLHPGVLRGEAEVLAGVHDRDRPLERLAQLAADQPAGLLHVHPAHVDPGHRDALGDHIVTRRVVRVSGHRASDQDQQENGDEDERLLPHVRARATPAAPSWSLGTRPAFGCA